MKTEAFAKLLRKVANANGDGEVKMMCDGIARLVERFPDGFRKPLQRVQVETNMTFEEMREALVAIKLFLVQPTMADRYVDEAQRRRARIQMDKLWNALMPDYEVKEEQAS